MAADSYRAAPNHVPFDDIVGSDVLVLPAAFPHERISSDAVGWLGVVQDKRTVRNQQQVQVFGAWFDLSDWSRICPMEQQVEDEEAEGEHSGEAVSEAEEGEGTKNLPPKRKRIASDSDSD